MKFSSRTEMALPVNASFAAFADFSMFERAAMRNGVDVRRVDDLTQPGPGMIWEILATFRGKPRRVSARLVDYDAPYSLTYNCEVEGFHGDVKIGLESLNSRTTGVQFSCDLQARSLTSKMMLQSLRLAKGRVNDRLDKGFHRLCKRIEARVLEG